MKKEKEYDYLANSASATECTGLIPTPADTEEERDSYDAIFRFRTPATSAENTDK